MPAMSMHEQKPAWHALSGEAALERLSATSEGLDTAEVTRRLGEHGPNRLPVAAGRGPLLRFLVHFHNILIYILLVAAVVTAVLDHWLDTWVILAVVIINAVIGFIQEGKAEKALEAIRNMLTHETRVLRGGERTIATEDLVPGDIVLLRAGEKVPADLRLIDSRDLQIEEAILTGESEASSKQSEPVDAGAVLGDRTCLAYSSTLVTYGTGRGVVVATGAATELGRINEMLGNVEKITTPLLQQMTRFGHLLSIAILGLAGFAFAYGTLVVDLPTTEVFLGVIALAIAAIPEGLPAIMTITLAIGVRRMAQRNAIIRQLPAVDTLGSVTVICSDKTGTLTRNEMTVTRLIVAGLEIEVSGGGYAPEGEFSSEGQPIEPKDGALHALLEAGQRCTEALLVEEDGRWTVQGAPTDGAVLVAAMKAGFDRETLRREQPEIDAIAFSSKHKFSARLLRREGGARIVMMGAPDRLLKRSHRELGPDGERDLDAATWEQSIETLAAQGLRVLGIARRDLADTPDRLDETLVADSMTLLGLVGILDPPRDEAIAAVGECKEAGIRVIMITGDHALTAQTIAGQIGIDHSSVRTGADLEEASDEDLQTWVRDTSVYARVSPEHKLRLVTALQANGAVVAMTGDGVNDAPAIKRADVGVGMGITGTEVTKEAADMVLADDNFASITSAVREGRTVYDNLRKAILFILPTNGGEALTLLAAIALGRTLPLTAGQILWVNMITAITLALALAFEPPEEDIMRRPPRAPGASMLDRYFLLRITYVSVIIGFGTFGMYLWAREQGYALAHAQTMAVNTLVLCEIAYLLNTRFITAPLLTMKGFFGSRPVLVSIALVAIAQVLYTYVPLMQNLFHATGLAGTDWLLCLIPAVVLLIVVEIEKAVTRSLVR